MSNTVVTVCALCTVNSEGLRLVEKASRLKIPLLETCCKLDTPNTSFCISHGLPLCRHSSRVARRCLAVTRASLPPCSSPEIETVADERRLSDAGPVDAETSPGGQATHSWLGGRLSQVHTHAHPPWKSRTEYIPHPHSLSLPLSTWAASALGQLYS